jgi:hypothetical protein
MTVYLPSGMDEFAPLTLEEAVYQAIGAASMCWEDVAKAGVFDSDRAKAIGDALLAKVAAPHSTGTDTGGPCCECCHEVPQFRDKWSRAVAEKVSLEARLAECREEAHRMIEAAKQ